eukprot:TRINITY_DN9658_c0_g1_i5.p1 TRINITY_DN9658_c0_g1~~TRINITY_DN9658_c0_g1_i5.p1  ORF type:complete len:565 (-),score=86.66 TRINITY_DN9658_c0_g1_i5:163-1857(-)
MEAIIPNKTIISGKFLIKEKLGSGSFGSIYKALSFETNEIVAVKVEKHSEDSYSSTLQKEARILSDMVDTQGFAKIVHYSRFEFYSVIVMSCLGFNLEKLFRHCNTKFSLPCVLILADQMLTRIEALHAKGFLHRDIKPENFVMGSGKTSRMLYLIDFGLSKAWRDGSGRHIPYKENKGMVGTARYASTNSHAGVEQSRRDDLESIGYLLVYFLKGRLPWQNLPCSSKSDKYAKIADVKSQTSAVVLCKDLPPVFITYFGYVKSLGFADAPDYKYLRKLFRQMFIQNGYDMEMPYDWLRQNDNSSPKTNAKRKEDANFIKFEEILKEGRSRESRRHTVAERNIEKKAEERPKILVNEVEVARSKKKAETNLRMEPVKSSDNIPRPDLGLAGKIPSFIADVSKDMLLPRTGDTKYTIKITNITTNFPTLRTPDLSPTNLEISQNNNSASAHSSKMIFMSQKGFEGEEENQKEFKLEANIQHARRLSNKKELSDPKLERKNLSQQFLPGRNRSKEDYGDSVNTEAPNEVSLSLKLAQLERNKVVVSKSAFQKCYESPERQGDKTTC